MHAHDNAKGYETVSVTSFHALGATFRS